MKFDFEQINLIPQKCIVGSRSECNTNVKLGNFTFKMPVIPANMECVINQDLSIKLGKNGYFYIMHRFLTNEEILNFIIGINSLNELVNIENKIPVSISVGVNQESYDLIDVLSDIWNPLRDRTREQSYYNVDFITIDIAHGHATKMEAMIKYIREKLPNIFIIAGNVSTLEAVKDLAEWGADAAKVGISPGCFTPDSLVLTDNGYKSLSEIKEGDSVLTHKNRYKKVISKQSYIGEQDLIKINNLPACTQSHEFYVIDKENKELVDESNIEEYAYWVQAKDLDKTKHLMIKN
jgi:IMP dehydrogenase/GMP reductase